MKVVDYALDNHKFTAVVYLTLIVLGAVSFLTMPRSEDPQLSLPISFIVAVYPGASPEDMEQLVADPIEEAITEIEKIKEIKTEIRDGMASIKVEFEYGTDPDKKYDDLLRAVGAINNELPAGLLSLDIKKLSPSDVNIIQVGLVSDSLPYSDLRLYASRLERLLESSDGIKQSDIWAIPDQQIQILVDFETLRHSGISLSQAYATIAGVGANVPAGHVQAGGQRFTVRSSGNYQNLEEIRETLLPTRNGRAVRIKDVAEVRFGDGDPTYLARYNRQRAVFVTAMQREGTNIFTVTDAALKIIEQYAANLPQGLRVEIALNQAHGVDSRINAFFINLLQGLAIVGVVVVLVLGFKISAIVIAVIPISILIAFALLDQVGFGIEQMSIIGLVIALGLLVDNAIVVVENILRRIHEGDEPMAAARIGTSTVAWPITNGTMTTILSFLPILTMQSTSGAFIRSLPVTVVLALLASLVVALTFTPYMTSRIIRSRPSLSAAARKPRFSLIDWVYVNVAGTYVRLLRGALRFKWLFLLVITGVFLYSLTLFKDVGLSLFPKAENNRVLINIDLPEGADFYETDRYADKVETILESNPHVIHFSSNIGRGNPRIYYSETPTNEMANHAQIAVEFEQQTLSDFKATIANLQAEFNRIAGAEIYIKEFQQGAPLEAPIVVRIYNENYQLLREVSHDIEAILAAHSQTVNIKNPVGKNKVDLNININKERAALLNVPIANIDSALRMSLIGLTVGEFRDEFGEEFNITVKMVRGDGASLEDVSDIMVENANGGFVPLRQVADLELVSEPAYIQHHNINRVAKLTAYVREGANVAAVTNEVMVDLEAYAWPGGFRYEMGGERKSRRESYLGFLKAIIIALFGIFTVLVFQFRSYWQSIMIFIAIPFALTGAILALLITGYTFSFMAFLGVAGLIGIVVNNSIILVDAANHHHAHGMSKIQAVIEAGRIRLTPILLTTVTTVGSLLPITLQGSLTWSPLGWVIIGGLVVSTVVTLFIVPVLYALFERQVKPV